MDALLDILEHTVKKVLSYILNFCISFCGFLDFYLNLLLTECPSGTFGLDCDYKCHLFCTGNTSCNHVTGVFFASRGVKKVGKDPYVMEVKFMVLTRKGKQNI